MDDGLQLLIDLHIEGDRQGPGGQAETLMALALSGIDRGRKLKVADIGCGTGASTLVLARKLDADITAVDFLPAFLARLEARAAGEDLKARIDPLAASMDDLPLEAGAFDLIWSEGAIYSMGFAKGLAAWRRFLKPGGVIAVSELTWLTALRPPELQSHWEREYAEVATASAKMAVLEAQGYAPIGYFTLGAHCWLENYYRPMQQRFPGFLKAHEHSDEAREVVAAEENEIALYEKYRDFVSYGFYIARKTAD